MGSAGRVEDATDVPMLVVAVWAQIRSFRSSASVVGGGTPGATSTPLLTTKYGAEKSTDFARSGVIVTCEIDDVEGLRSRGEDVREGHVHDPQPQVEPAGKRAAEVDLEAAGALDHPVLTDALRQADRADIDADGQRPRHPRR